jgi:hypothetical protein
MYQASTATNPVNVRDIITSRGGSTYKVVKADTNGFTVQRSTGSFERVPNSTVQRALATLESGQELKFQHSSTDGGISYTIAIEAGVIAALTPLVKRNARTFSLRA